MLLLSGMRVSELLASRWENVDLDARSLFVPMSKNGRSRHVPLSRAAIDVLREMKRPDGAVFLLRAVQEPYSQNADEPDWAFAGRASLAAR